MTDATKPAMPKWTEVAEWLYSVPVPGGTIYRYGTRYDAASIVFVPNPPQQVCPQQQLPVGLPVNRPYTPYHPGPYIPRTNDTAGHEVVMW